MRRALVTGASAGLGLALVRALLADGWHIMGVDRDAAVDGLTPEYDHRRCDLSDPDAVDALCAALPPALDLAIMCAGISATGRFEAIPAGAHARVLAVNAEAPLVIADALIARGGLNGLVLVASLSVDVGYPGAASYAASKEAVVAYARSLRRVRRAPRVLTVLPGPIRTEHAARHAPDGASDKARMDPDDLARRILAAVRSGRRTLRPGMAATLAGAAGRLAPGATARAMRQALFDKLDRDVW